MKITINIKTGIYIFSDNDNSDYNLKHTNNKGKLKTKWYHSEETFLKELKTITNRFNRENK